VGAVLPHRPCGGRAEREQEQPWDAELHSLPAASVAQFNARCLDGSAPGYYIRRNASDSRWKFHIQGGGWCLSPSDCLSRSQSLLGSSKSLPTSLAAFWQPEGAGFYGLMAPNNATNDYNPFGAYNFVWLTYCDGSSFTSNRDAPVVVNGTSLYMRGRAILDAHLAELEATAGFLSTATEVIVSGTSAGGLATYLHASYVASRLAKGSAVAVPDAGYFFDHETYNKPGVHEWLDSITAAIAPELWNATLLGPLAGCLAAPPGGLRARCFLPEGSFPWQTTPFFIVNSLYDPANLGIVYKLSCNLYSSCSQAELAAVHAYAADLQSSILNTINATRDAYFLTSCYQHEESCRARDWFGITIGGQTMNSSFTAWYESGVESASSRRVDVPWPGDSSCAAQGFTHGAC
jgi:hypothetical protein